MKSQTLPTKRSPAQKGIIRRLSAKTRTRKQRASAATANDFDMDEGNSKISRALTIIFLIHVVAIALIFIHHRFLDGRPVDDQASATSAVPSVMMNRDKPQELSPLSSGEAPYIVKAGDSYQAVANAYGVHVDDLKAINQQVPMRTGLILKIPAKRVVVARPQRVIVSAPVEAPVVRESAPARDQGLVDAVDFVNAPRAELVNAENLASDKTYVVQAGDSIWRISNKFKVDQKLLMELNGISDARKLRSGMTLKIP